jgi:multisubunit Na+/H+ antiporter MnhG subunit
MVKRSSREPVPAERCLKGVLISITGLEASLKEQLHEFVVALGGSYTATLTTSVNTHLIAGATNGEKYEEASRSSR